MITKPACLIVLFSGILGLGCDPEEMDVAQEADVAEDDAERDLDAALNLSDEGKPIKDSGGISPQAKHCCVSCNGDNWTGWWDRGTGNSPTCNTRGPKWCHDHNWDFGNAEWFYTCPSG